MLIKDVIHPQAVKLFVNIIPQAQILLDLITTWMETLIVIRQFFTCFTVNQISLFQLNTAEWIRFASTAYLPLNIFFNKKKNMTLV